jgi:hypothetical protein
MSYRGSRMHVLDWTEQENFVTDLLGLVPDAGIARLTANSMWMPRSYRQPDEALLERFGPRAIPNHPAWEQFAQWWLVDDGYSLNWDIVVACELLGNRGLILVEAKAHANEFAVQGKPAPDATNARNEETHDGIGQAIEQARDGLAKSGLETSISRDACYQLSNRVAFTWKLATLGIPTALVYLGFLGDEGMSGVGPHFDGEEHWRRAFEAHANLVNARALFQDEPTYLGNTPAWFLVRSRSVLRQSPPRA